MCCGIGAFIWRPIANIKSHVFILVDLVKELVVL